MKNNFLGSRVSYFKILCDSADIEILSEIRGKDKWILALSKQIRGEVEKSVEELPNNSVVAVFGRDFLIHKYSLVKKFFEH